MPGLGATAHHASVQQMQDQVLAWKEGEDQANPPPTNEIFADAGVFTDWRVQVLDEPSAEVTTMRDVHADFMAKGVHSCL